MPNYFTIQRCFFPFIFLLFQFSLFAQKQITGTITDAKTGEPMVGVSVFIKDSPGNGTISDLDGSYQLQAPGETTVLIFSFVGYEILEMPVGAGATLDVSMQEDAQQLNEVVVTALGIKRQKREIGYSTESFEGDEVLLSNAPNVVSALSGKSAGVQVTSPNGVDGGTTRITIRGNNNIDANNQPLVVVDGVPLENDPGLTNIGRGVDWGSAINNINPNDIESINILKGPTASALYGSRGGNGVVLITTKRGGKQKGIGISYNVQHKVIQPYYYRDVQNIYGAGGPISLLEPTLPTNDDGVYVYPVETHATNGPYGRATTELFGYYSTGVSWGPKMEGQQVLWWDGEMRSFDPQPDNLKQYFSDGNTTTHNLSFSGGGKMGTMRVSLTRTDHDAIIPNSKYDQTTVNLGSRLDISPKVHADIALSYINYNRLNSPTLGDDNNRSFGKGILYSWPRSYKGLEKDLDILPDGTRNDYGGKYPFTFAPPHLWWNTYNNNTELNRNKLIGALALTYDVTPWLNLTGRVGTDFTLNQFETRNKPIDKLGILEGYYANELGRDLVRNNEFLITVHKDKLFHSDFNASLSFGGTQWSRSIYGLKGESGKWVNPWLYSFNNFEDRLTVPITNERNEDGTTRRFEKKINSLYSFLNLGFKDFVFLEITGRNDWNSTLPIESNAYFYPSASLSFIPTKAFDFKQEWLSFWKIRGAYARTASDTDPYQVNFVYSTSTFGSNQTASLPDTIPPIALKPQNANSFEVGTTLGLFNDRINFDFTYYYIRSYDQILNSPLPSSSGASFIKINTGILENKGFEAILNATLIEKRHFFWQTGFNISRNRNYVVSLGEGAKTLELADIWGLNGPAIAVREGEEYGTIVGYDYVFDEASGKPILNEDGTLYQISESRVPIGNASPDFIGGWTMRLGFKGLTLSTLVDTKWGGDIYAGSYVIGLQTGQSPETLPERQGQGLPYTDPEGNVRNVGVILDGVYADGTVNDKVVHYYFKYVGNTGGWGRFISTPGIKENTWVKMREISLSYQFPSKLAQKTKIFQDLTLSLTGRDLFYIYSSLPDRINPEASNGAGNAQGLEWASFPGTRSFTVGLNAAF
ncbi:MAG: SusC/RagA family TonB-linked outer membrane protein [Lewinellaceae bacterium]|nr:SusC/RagA family TonB-linked outer membrane protein [Saprospiraceae bacterium]MCB9337174.1 SusC/RagA family TonB-linked outer membrane protein [Lewinellaceae bacterium]